MSIPYIYLYVPPISRPENSYVMEWLADTQTLMGGDPNWDDCDVKIVELTDQLGFNLTNEVRRIKTNLGPAIFVSKVQHAHFKRLSDQLNRDVRIYSAQGVTCGIELFQFCEDARLEYLGGEPKISRRELICYLIITKLHRRDHWAGEAKNKSFLRADDLPKGGFPGDVSNREILDAADVLTNAGILSSKRGDGRTKYGFGDKVTIEGIIASRSLSGNPSMEKWFRKDKARVPARELTRNYE